MDTLGIIRQMEADPALRAQLRAVLLGDDLLDLPRRMDQVQAALERLADAQVATEARMGELADVQSRTLAQLGELAEALARLGAVASTNTNDVGELKGKLLEDTLRSQPARMGLRRVIRRYRLVERDELEDWMEEAGLDLDGIEPLGDPGLADLVLDGISPADGEALALVVEASWRVDLYDVERARARAKTLGQLGRRALGAVAGRFMTDTTQEAAQQEGVATFVSPGL